MDKVIQVEKHHIEAWGIWWIQYQKLEKERLKKQAKEDLVRSKRKDSAGNTASSSAITTALLPK